MARMLQSMGFRASALLGGYNAWRAKYTVEPKGINAERDLAFAADQDRMLVGSDPI